MLVTYNGYINTVGKNYTQDKVELALSAAQSLAEDELGYLLTDDYTESDLPEAISLAIIFIAKAMLSNTSSALDAQSMNINGNTFTNIDKSKFKTYYTYLKPYKKLVFF